MRLCIKPIIDRYVRQWRDFLIITFHTNSYIIVLLCRDRLAPLRLQHGEQARQEAASPGKASKCGPSTRTGGRRRSPLMTGNRWKLLVVRWQATSLQLSARLMLTRMSRLCNNSACNSIYAVDAMTSGQSRRLQDKGDNLGGQYNYRTGLVARQCCWYPCANIRHSLAAASQIYISGRTHS